MRQHSRLWLIFLVIALLAAGCRQRTPTPVSTPTETVATEAPTATPEPTPVNPTAAVSPASGPSGAEVQVVASGFPPETEIDLGVGPQGEMYELVINAQTDAQGNLTQKLAIPASAEPGESWVIVAMTEDGALQAESNVFEVVALPYEPEVRISPTSGQPATQIDVVVAGFPPDAIVDIGVGRENSEYDVVDTIQVGNDGGVMTKARIPTFAEIDERWVVVVTTQDQSVEAVSNVFQVTEAQYEGAVAISLNSGPPGTRLSVIAEGFPSNTIVEIGVGRVDSEYDVIATAETDADGRAETQITMPAFVEPGDPYVIVVADESRPIKAVSDVFDVTTGPTPTPSGEDGKWEDDLFTRTNIYLVAVGDEGESGEEIGCGDSLIPVEVEIEPTIAPMTAALEKLLAIDTREYGQSGLYSALYRSDLTVEGIDIEDREAIINLSGELVAGGVCDTPRIQAQLRQTALQYSTVDEVSIFINGEPLDDLLSEQG